MLRVWIIRHGKAEEHGVKRDYVRQLAARGHSDGELMRTWFGAHEHPAHWLWVSSAARTQETAVYVKAGFTRQDQACETVTEEALYLSSPETMLGCLQETPALVSCAGIVAHNPGCTQLANWLASEPVIDALPTFGSVLLAFPDADAWPDVRPGTGQLESLQRPKVLR